MLIPSPQTLPAVAGPDFKPVKRHRGDDNENNGDGVVKQGNEAVDPSGAVADPSQATAVIVPSSALVDSAGAMTSASLTSTTSDAVATASGSATSPLQFLNIQNATTCQSYAFSWAYTGSRPRSALTLLINESSLRSRDNNTTGDSSYYKNNIVTIRILSTNISPNTTNFTWDPVDLKEGWYILDMHITKPDRTDDSTSWPTSFYVINGTDTSCVKFDKPITGSHPHLGTGDIAAIVVGAIAAAGLLAVAFAFPRLWRRDLPSPKRPRPYYLY